MNRQRWVVCTGILLTAFILLCVSVQKKPAGHIQPDISAELTADRPIDAVDTVFLEEMTWMEVRDAIHDGATRVLVAAGGIEQNGPYVALGKHNYILQLTSEALARALGKTLVAPIIKYVPEGAFSPPSGHMRYPGTLSVQESTFCAVLTDIAWSLEAHGFLDIIFIGDSGGNQQAMKQVASQLNHVWGCSGSRIHFIPEYYNYPELEEVLRKMGIELKPETFHDDFIFSTQVMVNNPQHVRMQQRQEKDLFSISGIHLAPVKSSVELGKKLIAYRVERSKAAIEKALANRCE